MLSDFGARGVVVLGDVPRPADVVGPFRTLVAEHFPAARAHVLVRDVSRSLRLLMVAARRRAAPYNVLLRLDLDAAPDGAARAALERFRDEVRPAARRLLVFGTVNHQFHRLDAGPGDVAMAFINTWPAAGPSREEAQRYWLDQHGPLVLKVGLPPVVTSYTQVHFDDSWDTDYQGLSFETITGQRDLVRYFLRDRAVRRLNRI